MNHMKKILLILLICVSSLPLISQNVVKGDTEDTVPPGWYFGVEAGITSFNAIENPKDFIREEASYYYGYHGNYSALSLTSFSYSAALTAEYRTLDDHLWISSGISYSTMNSSIAKYSGSDSHPDYFYVFLKQQQNESYYLRISDVDFLSHYINVPFDFSIAPISAKYFMLYGKLSADMNFRVATNKRATFYNEDMSSYEPAVLDLFDSPKNFYATAGFGGGIQIGRKHRPVLRFDFDFITFVLTKEAFSLVDQNIGFGCNVSFVIPFNNM